MRKIDISWFIAWVLLATIFFIGLDYALDKTFDSTETTEQTSNDN